MKSNNTQLLPENIKDFIKREVNAAMQEYKEEQAEKWYEHAERVRDDAKMLITHYRRFKRMENTSIYNADSVTNPTLMEILGNILGEIRREEFTLTSVKKNKIVTGMLMNHVDVQLENYKKECEMADEPEVQRRYRIVEMMYLRDKPLKIDEVANIEGIDPSNVYRTLKRAYEDLAMLFFGVEALDVSRTRRKKSNKDYSEGDNNEKVSNIVQKSRT